MRSVIVSMDGFINLALRQLYVSSSISRASHPWSARRLRSCVQMLQLAEPNVATPLGAFAMHGRKEALRIFGPPETRRIVDALLTQIYDKDWQ
jgi:hypothetical protein